MASRAFSNVVFLLLVLAIISCTAALNAGSPTDRILRAGKAAIKKDDLFRRNLRIERKFRAELSYIETENGWTNNQIFASQVTVESEIPVLNLEEIENHLRNVQCGSQTITLHFVDSTSAKDAVAACMGEKGGLVITSHETCNTEGERSVYRISKVQLSDDEFVLSLSVAELAWKDAFKTLKIDAGYTTSSHLLRRHSDFAKLRKARKREMNIPPNIPEDVTSATLDISYRILNHTLDEGSLISGDISFLSRTTCINCTASGSLEITQASFSVDIGRVDLDPNIFNGIDASDLPSLIQSGFVELKAKNMAAHIALISRPESNGEFEALLTRASVAGFVIPKIGRAGVAYETKLVVSYEVTAPLTLTHGFYLVVPNDSTFRLDILSASNSTLSGFQDTKFSALPIIPSDFNAEFAMDVGFRAHVPLTFEFLNRAMAVNVSGEIDFGKLSSKVTTKSAGSVGPDCNSIETTPSCNVTRTPSFSNCSNTGFQSSPVNLEALQNLGPLMNIEHSLNISAGIAAAYNLPILILDPSFSTSAQVFETHLSLTTSCLAASFSMAPATQVFASMTSSLNSVISASSASSKSAADARSRSTAPYTNGTRTAVEPSTTFDGGATGTPPVITGGGETGTPLPSQPVGAAAGLWVPGTDRWVLAWQYCALVFVFVAVGMMFQ